ncbi:hypothetical protein FGK63_18730 [Ruegeria sediminis]|uniref:Uncharacterized protein n=1 Tax=Ruegeria sediminis TaxID=2583820 RepID=A0ABY2WSN9_9RHOB|nr:hypothetical protein [Ruegeria sediminis]TMV03705.1 hypothetical protein FGK63_18730 [Ruegeria sediminis]
MTARDQKIAGNLPSLAVCGIVTLAAPVAAVAQSQQSGYPIHCATAEGDIRALNSELEHAKKQQALDVAAITPAGALIGLATGTEKKRLEMLTGEYQKKLEERIAAINARCK